MTASQRSTHDQGFGLVEVVVAMMILMVVFLAFGALLLQSLTVVADNGTRATAAQLATELVEEARREATTGSCSNVNTLLTTPRTIPDGRGVELSVRGEITPGSCDQPAGDERGNPRLAEITLWVDSTKASGTKREITLETEIWVRAT